LESDLGHLAGEVAPETVRFLGGRPVDDVLVRSEGLQQLRDLLRRMLQVVIDGDDELVAGQADAAKQRVVLAVVAHEVNTPHPAVIARKALDHAPRAVAAAVVDDDQLIVSRGRVQHRLKPADQLG